MNESREGARRQFNTKEIATIGVVTGLYVVITLFLSVISFGALQLRLAEMFNYLSLYNKKYVWAVTLGVAIANIFSPLGVIDVAVGSVCTFLVLQFNLFITRNMTSMPLKLAVTAVIFAISMFTVSGQLTIMYQAPFFINWLAIGLGELFSMTVGGVLIHWISKKIDLTK
ncbi:QueT transporter family protein [Vagococcus xieshaowenii]|uniref:QueT transporter family protein n=1 Tax=Vagococcus xieshaowenii TaxID=2562451 RepID=A0AAJ5EFE4_9ENTE|nr:QueT transporter family protein [Vagococcus xieshaowenii]QCA27960.1 QueT transporter family protein [Vagococcus xieshaowenii]TFZ41272.1 QueT transporter family protein [Vagococcus xieshaowenii]